MFFDIAENGAAQDELPPAEEFPQYVMMRGEKEALGFYLTGSPLSGYDQYIRLNGLKRVSEILSDCSVGARLRFIAVITSKKDHTAKNNSKMCFLSFEDDTGEIEGLMFEDVMNRSLRLLSEGEFPLLINASVTDGDDRKKVIVNDVQSMQDIKVPVYSTVFMKAASFETDKINRAAAVLKEYAAAGEAGEKARIALSDTRKVISVDGAENVMLTKELTEKLIRIFGKANVMFR